MRAAPLHGASRAQPVHVVASTAVGGPSLGHRSHKLAVRARRKNLGLLRVTSPAEHGDLVRRGNAIRFRGPRGRDVTYANTVTSRAVEASAGMFVGIEVLAHGRMAADTGGPDGLLRRGNRGEQEPQSYKPHCGFLTMASSIEARSFLPASATASLISAESNSYTRCTPSWPNAARPQR